MKTFHSSLLSFAIAFAALTFSFSQRSLAQTYTVDSIAYQPYSFTGGSPLLIGIDDHYSQVLPIGFNFVFFGNTYSQLVVGSNGNLNFNLSNVNGFDNWALDSLPIPGSSVPFNSIFGAYRDIDNTYNGSVTYRLLGTAPNRVYVISYDSIPLFGSDSSVSPGHCRSTLSTFQIALYENCNNIEVYIHNSPSCAAWNRGLGIIGILDSTGTVGVAAPGRNNLAWSATDEAWRFSVTGSGSCTRSSAGLDQTLCLHHIATMQATGAGVWSASGANPTAVTIDNASSPGTTISGFSAIGAYGLTWTTATDTSTITVNVVACSDSVWPGDADHNGLVDNHDLLPIGLAYDSVGPVRAVPGAAWQPAACSDWADSFTAYTPAVNFKHADCNGDGIVDLTDEQVIYQNFSFLHAKTNGPSPSRSGVPTLYAVASRDSLRAGDLLTINFVLADSSISVNNFYGLAFTYNYDPMLVDSAFTAMTYSNSWIGSADKISFVKILPSSGEIMTAVTRTDHASRSGYGAIGSATFKVRSDLSAQALSYLVHSGYISNITAVDPTGHAVTLNAGTDTTIIAVSPAGISDVTTAAVSVRPNPAHDKVNISANDMIHEISIINMLGQQMMNNSSVNARSLNIDISALDNGLYIIQLKTATKTGVSRLVIER